MFQIFSDDPWFGLIFGKKRFLFLVFVLFMIVPTMWAYDAYYLPWKIQQRVITAKSYIEAVQKKKVEEKLIESTDEIRVMIDCDLKWKLSTVPNSPQQAQLLSPPPPKMTKGIPFSLFSPGGVFSLEKGKLVLKGHTESTIQISAGQYNGLEYEIDGQPINGSTFKITKEVIENGRMKISVKFP